jgi:hypothetical protein
MLKILLSTILVLNIFIGHGHLSSLNVALSKHLELNVEPIQTSNNETCGMSCCANKVEKGSCSCCKKEIKTPTYFLPISSEFPFLTNEQLKFYNNISNKDSTFSQESLNSACSCSDTPFNGLITFLDLPEKSISLVKPNSLTLFEQLYFNYQITNKPSFVHLRSPPFLA